MHPLGRTVDIRTWSVALYSTRFATVALTRADLWSLGSLVPVWRENIGVQHQFIFFQSLYTFQHAIIILFASSFSVLFPVLCMLLENRIPFLTSLELGILRRRSGSSWFFLFGHPAPTRSDSGTPSTHLFGHALIRASSYSGTHSIRFGLDLLIRAPPLFRAPTYSGSIRFGHPLIRAPTRSSYSDMHLFGHPLIRAPTRSDSGTHFVGHALRGTCTSSGPHLF